MESARYSAGKVPHAMADDDKKDLVVVVVVVVAWSWVSHKANMARAAVYRRTDTACRTRGADDTGCHAVTALATTKLVIKAAKMVTNSACFMTSATHSAHQLTDKTSSVVSVVMFVNVNVNVNELLCSARMDPQRSPW